MLIYPMLDDRTTLKPDSEAPAVRVWTTKSNRFGWKSYLGEAVGGPNVSVYAAPARRDDLRGLPATWIGVGTLDLFHAEDIEYANRLADSGVDVDLVEIAGAFHGFDTLFGKAAVSRDFWRKQAEALRAAFA